MTKTGETNCTTSLSDGRKKGPQHNKQFAAEIAKVANSSKVDINRKLRRTDAIGSSDLKKISGTSLDKGVEMDALIKMKEPDRLAGFYRLGNHKKSLWETMRLKLPNHGLKCR